MALSGTAFLALWNNRSEARLDYEAWHTREHIPQRLGVPGMLAGRRYVEGDGPLPMYFTLYPLASLEVLASPEYSAVVSTPTAWSQSMRPALSHMYRRGCLTTLSLGAGIGGCLAAVLLRGGHDAAQAARSFADLAAFPAFCGLHLGRIAEIAALPFEPSAPAALPKADAILLVEGFDWNAFSTALDSLDGLIVDAGYERLLPWTRYRFAYAVDRGGVDAVLPVNDELIRRTVGRSA